MDQTSLRHRKPWGTSSGQDERRGKSKIDPPTDGAGDSLSWKTAFLLLLISRLWSASVNIVHDCDETFNYWEPLHYLLYGSGLQTWEYSPEFGLRSYLYLLLHSVIAWPAKLVLGDGSSKALVFYAVRAALGACSAASEAALVAAASAHGGRRLGTYTLLLLAFTSGCFFASTTFLPGTFSMYSITLAAAATLAGRPRAAVAAAAIGVILGWPFAVLAAAPLVLHALATGGFWKVVVAGCAASLPTLGLSVLADRAFYGRWVCSVLNLVLYNVAGGGDSALYGVEGPLFYLRNGANNFNAALPLALALPVAALLSWRPHRPRRLPMAAALAPLFLWLAFMSLQPHKEERFLYVVYPLLCLAAAATIDAVRDLLPLALRGSPECPSVLLEAAKLLRPLLVSLILVLSHARTTAILGGYSAPMSIYRQLPGDGAGPVISPGAGSGGPPQPTLVCVGREWHRFPSSFFLPSPSYRVAFLDDGFRGLLPFPFDTAAGGTAAASPHLNKRNEASPWQFVPDEDRCDYLVEFDPGDAPFPLRSRNASRWEVVAEERMLNADKSPALYRAFYVPFLSQKHNSYGMYKLMRRTSGSGERK